STTNYDNKLQKTFIYHNNFAKYWNYIISLFVTFTIGVVLRYILVEILRFILVVNRCFFNVGYLFIILADFPLVLRGMQIIFLARYADNFPDKRSFLMMILMDRELLPLCMLVSILNIINRQISAMISLELRKKIDCSIP